MSMAGPEHGDDGYSSSDEYEIVTETGVDDKLTPAIASQVIMDVHEQQADDAGADEEYEYDSGGETDSEGEEEGGGVDSGSEKIIDKPVGVEAEATIVETAAAVPEPIVAIRPPKQTYEPMVHKTLVGTMNQFVNQTATFDPAKLMDQTGGAKRKLIASFKNTTPFSIGVCVKGQTENHLVHDADSGKKYQWVIPGNESIGRAEIGKWETQFLQSGQQIAEMRTQAKSKQLLHDAVVGHEMFQGDYMVPVSAMEGWDEEAINVELGASESMHKGEAILAISKERVAALANDIDMRSKEIDQVVNTKHDPIDLEFTLIGAEKIPSTVRATMMIPGTVSAFVRAE